ncbi:(2Fe-2S)-binding protein [Streptomyces violaceorubidus]
MTRPRDEETTQPPSPGSGPPPWGRRRFLGYVLAAPTLMTAAQLVPASPARAGLPSPEITELVDLNDVMRAAALPTSGLITVEVNPDGTVSFALPRTEMKDLRPSDEVTTIEGLPATVGADLHPMQQAWIDLDVAQCGYCQPGQIMTAVALVRRVQEEGRAITDADLDGIRNICRCGTCPRIREAIRAGAETMRPHH